MLLVDLLFFACVLHNVGLTEDANKTHRFEVDGADFVAEFLTRRGLGAAQVDTIWQAIALNTSLGIAERRGAVCALTLAGVSVAFGVDAAFIPDATAAASTAPTQGSRSAAHSPTPSSARLGEIPQRPRRSRCRRSS